MTDEELLAEQTKDWIWRQIMVGKRSIGEREVLDFQSGWEVRHQARNDANWKAGAL